MAPATSILMLYDVLFVCSDPNCYTECFFYDPFFASSCGRNFEDIDLRFFANCRRRMIVFFNMHICGHLFILLSLKRKFEKQPILQNMHSSINIDHVFF